MSGRKRHAEVLHELAVLNARIDDLVGLITSQMPDDAFPCDASFTPYRTTDARPGFIVGPDGDAIRTPNPRTAPTPADLAEAFGFPTSLILEDGYYVVESVIVWDDI